MLLLSDNVELKVLSRLYDGDVDATLGDGVLFPRDARPLLADFKVLCAIKRNML